MKKFEKVVESVLEKKKMQTSKKITKRIRIK